MMRSILLISLMLLSITVQFGFGQTAIREALFDGSRSYLINDNWLYLEDNIEDVQGLEASKAEWTVVKLPHTWNAFDPVDVIPGYRRSGSWYKRTIPIPASIGDSRLLLCFEGVNTVSKVFVNGQYAGGHVGGYIGFELDVTAFIHPGSENEILVRADNSIDPNIIPSQKSDFTIYGGICRNVWLKVVPATYLQSVKVRTPSVSKAKAEARVEVAVAHTRDEPVSLLIETVVKDTKGKIVARAETTKRLGNGINLVELALPPVKNPSLWSPADPALYSVTVTLKSKGEALDVITDRFGFRWFEFKEHGPFHLNGERLLLRGTHRHEEYAGLGNALPDSLHRKDMAMIKEMGANFVRLGHYPQAPEVYRACDELGLLVWDELPWCRGGMGGDVWKENTRRLLKEMIDENFNHPSIIIWSLGNEFFWLPEFPDGDNTDSLRTFLSILNDDAHALDPSRLTATRKFYEGSELTDAFSPSIWMGWYSGEYFSYERAISEARGKYKQLFHAEYGGDSHVGRHVERPVTGDGYTADEGWDSKFVPAKLKNVSVSGDWGESYMVNLFDWHLHVSEKLDWLTGNAQWAFKDFATPLRPENPIPYVNQKGLVDRAGNPKDVYYVFKSYWTKDPPFVYVESPTWTHRSGPRGMKREVKVFSNCDEVELFLNNTSQGRIRRDATRFPAQGLRWEVLFAEGENILEAVGFSNGKKVADHSFDLSYAYRKHQQADNLELSSRILPNGNVLITAHAIDKNGQICLNYNKRIYFSANGNGHLLVNYGTPTRSEVIEMASGKAHIEFVPSVKGMGTVEARNQDFKGSYIRIGSEEILRTKEMRSWK